MIVNKTYEIDSCDDVELGIKRTSKLEFKLWYDESKDIEALVFIAQGVGADCNDKYLDLILKSLLKTFNVAFVGVNYHCIGNRPQTGSRFYLDDIDKLILKTSCQTIDLKLPFDLSGTCDQDRAAEIFRFINDTLIERKMKGAMDPNFYLNLHISMQPTKNEYQNFGLMQATDLLNTALYLKKNAPFNTTGGGVPIIMIGGSHGGYLAHLAAKFAPWLVDGVIDNSSSAKFLFLWRFVGFGKEIDFMQYSEFATYNFYNHIRTCASTRTFWTSNTASPYFFSPARRKIRNLFENEHLARQAKCLKTHFVSYHSLKDEYIPLEEKNIFYKELANLGFDATLHAITKEAQIDGKFIKNLNHGMGIPLKLLIKKELPLMLEKIKQNPKKAKKDFKEKCVSYPCEDLFYQFSQQNDKIALKIEKI